ncbi:fused MFS/spermidine synthase [Congregibacter brevis]|uniref:Fused MFS/spermidine synthase n=1 Tax=Congregibacter brevis TaxID=3081201 RepID=A0ABZ0ID13_9GAMM|nr:fused MFS/spermidine synthase [Congregibacter sp. IMCC45268]
MILRTALLVVAMTQTVAAAQDVKQHGDTLPDATDRELVMEACTRCHGIDLVVEQRRSPDEWIQVVSMMVGSGMALTDEKYRRIVSYLSENLASPAPPQLIYQAPSTFNRSVLVVDHKGYRSLRFGNADDRDQSRIKPGHPEQLPMPYLRSAAVGLAVPQKLERLLVIGLGGGAFPAFIRADFPGVYIDAVEIDPVVAKVAIEYFDVFADDKLQIHIADAVDFVREDRKPYDYIFLDAYDADQLPDALTTRRFFNDVKANLTADGVVVANIAVKSHSKARTVARKLMSFYNSCLHLRSAPSLNDVLLLSDNPLPGRSDLLTWAERSGNKDATWQGMTDHIRAAKTCP